MLSLRGPERFRCDTDALRPLCLVVLAPAGLIRLSVSDSGWTGQIVCGAKTAALAIARPASRPRFKRRAHGYSQGDAGVITRHVDPKRKEN